jgi:hypothetical protein
MQYINLEPKQPTLNINENNFVSDDDEEDESMES